MTLSKLFRVQEGFLHRKVAPQPQKCPEFTKKCPAKITHRIARSPLSGDPAAVKLVTNYSIFIKWPKAKLLALKRGFLYISQTGSLTTKGPELAKKGQGKSPPK